MTGYTQAEIDAALKDDSDTEESAKVPHAHAANAIAYGFSRRRQVLLLLLLPLRRLESNVPRVMKRRFGT